MRKYLFRGWKLQTGWVYGDLIHKNYIPGSSQETVYIQNYGGTYAVYPDSVGEYIGMEDCTGTRIFEGDIITLCHEDDRGVVEWDEEELHWNAIFEGRQCDLGASYYAEDIVVVGNTFENSEL